ncbi:MAG: site-specific DNA-methyltransferase [Myxococcota bacterium]|nr:site-specific DNA-methyltransferase [Myxococcota bacterium]
MGSAQSGDQGPLQLTGSTLSWPERPEMERRLATLPKYQLIEDYGESIWWEGARHALIEGDNLAALVALQEPLSGAAKLIYLDPPYNNKRDLLYRDDSGMPPREGVHDSRSRWLSFIYPRLLLARSLLKEDGFICASIDDQELPTLRLLMDEIFGQTARLATFIWETKRAARGVPPRSMVMSTHEYLLCYGRDPHLSKLAGLPRDDADFSNPDEDPRGPWRSESMKSTGRRGREFTITDPESGRTFKGRWAFSEEKVEAMIHAGLVLFPKNKGGVPRQKKHQNSYRNPNKAGTSMLGWHSTERATRALMRLFDGEKIFSFPKPQSLLRTLLAQSCTGDDLVIDLFAGSGSMGAAVIEDNRDRGGALRSLSVQIPEPFDPKRPGNEAAGRLCAQRGSPPLISTLTRERLRRVLKQGQAQGQGAGVGEGLRCFHLIEGDALPPHHMRTLFAPHPS